MTKVSTNTRYKVAEAMMRGFCARHGQDLTNYSVDEFLPEANAAITALLESGEVVVNDTQANYWKTRYLLLEARTKVALKPYAPDQLQAWGEYKAHGGKLDFTAWQEQKESE